MALLSMSTILLSQNNLSNEELNNLEEGFEDNVIIDEIEVNNESSENMDNNEQGFNNEQPAGQSSNTSDNLAPVNQEQDFNNSVELNNVPMENNVQLNLNADAPLQENQEFQNNNLLNQNDQILENNVINNSLLNNNGQPPNNGFLQNQGNDGIFQENMQPADNIMEGQEDFSNQLLLNEEGNLPLENQNFQSNGMFGSETPMEESAQTEMSSPSSQTSLNIVGTPNLFSGAPPIPGSLRNLTQGEAPEEYRVELGDTLYDICDQLLDEPGYWPKLWSLNPYIRNPHFIFPGMKLRFFSGDAVTPPFLQVVTEDEVIPVDTAEIKKEEILRQDISSLLTRAERLDRTPVLIPEEMGEFPEIDEAFLRQGDIFSSDSFSVILPAFIFASPRTPLAKIIGGSEGSFLMDKGQDIIMQAKEGGEPLKNILTVLRFSRKVYHPESDEFIGYRYEFIGHIGDFKVIDHDDQLVSGKVIFSRLGLRPGDIVSSFLSVKRQIPLISSSTIMGDQTVIGFEFPESRMGGRGSFVFLDKGAHSHLKPGTSVKLFQNVSQNAGIFTRSRLPHFNKFVAEAFILESTERATVAYIVKDRFEVKIGDKTSVN